MNNPTKADATKSVGVRTISSPQTPAKKVGVRTIDGAGQKIVRQVPIDQVPIRTVDDKAPKKTPADNK
jgi:hypothetical protein